MDTATVQAASQNSGGWNLIFNLAIPAIIAAFVTLAVNWLTTKWRAKHEYRTHALKIFFEKKLEAISYLVQVIYELDFLYGRKISSRSLKVAQQDNEFWGLYQEKCFELKRALVHRSLYLHKDFVTKIDAYFKYMFNLDWQQDEAYNHDKKPDQKAAFPLREEKIKRLISDIQKSVEYDLKKIGIDANVCIVPGIEK